MPSYSWTLSIPVAPTDPALADVVFADEATTEPVDFGFDILALPDLDVSFTPRRDVAMLADAFARRLFTPRGRLWAHPNYGFDVRDYLNDTMTRDTLQQIKAGCEAQAEQDERFFATSTRVAYDARREALYIQILLQTEAGPFSLVMNVTSLTADIVVEA